MSYVMKVYDGRFGLLIVKFVLTYSSRNDLVNDLKRVANDYIDKLVTEYGAKPDVCCYYTSRGKATVDIYNDDDEYVIASIDLIGV